MKSKGNLPLNLALSAAAVVFCLVLLEGALRVFPNNYLRQFEIDAMKLTRMSYVPVGDGLYTLRPSFKFRHAAACFDNPEISTNSLGFRGFDTPLNPGGFIALLGDSLVEGLQVSEESLLGAILSLRLGEPVLNAGISGYSTVTQLMAYERILRKLKPKLVVLAFYLGNDVEGNSCKLSQNSKLPCLPERPKGDEPADAPSGIAAAKRPLGPGQGGEADWEETFQASITRVKAFFRDHLVIYQMLHQAKSYFLLLAGGTQSKGFDHWDLYLAQSSDPINEGWNIAEDRLSRLKRAVTADGANLAILAIPEYVTLSPSWKLDLLKASAYIAPDDFDPDLPMSRLEEIARRLGIPLLNPTPRLRDYASRHKLGAPYYSFSCDGHLNPLGHYLIAHELAAWLTDRKLAASASAARMSAERDQAFSRNPMEILGPRAFREIYGGGVYLAQ